MGLMLSSRSCLTHQNKFVDSSTATHGAADWRMLAVRRLAALNPGRALPFRGLRCRALHDQIGTGPGARWEGPKKVQLGDVLDPTSPLISPTFIARVDYFLILHEDALWRNRVRRGARIDFAPNSLLRSKRRNYFPARPN